MGFFQSIGLSIKNHFDKRSEEREMVERLNLEAEAERRRIFQEEYRKNALEVARSKAQKEAAEKSGLMKLRATNRLRNLQKQDTNDGSFFSKFRDYTQKNIATREANLKKTEELRKIAKENRERQLQENKKERELRMAQRNKPFNRRVL